MGRGTWRPLIIHTMFNFLKILRNTCNMVLKFDKIEWWVHWCLTYSLPMLVH